MPQKGSAELLVSVVEGGVEWAGLKKEDYGGAVGDEVGGGPGETRR